MFFTSNPHLSLDRGGILDPFPVNTTEFSELGGGGPAIQPKFVWFQIFCPYYFCHNFADYASNVF